MSAVDRTIVAGLLDFGMIVAVLCLIGLIVGWMLDSEEEGAAESTRGPRRRPRRSGPGGWWKV